MLELLLDEINKIQTLEIKQLTKSIIDKIPLKAWSNPSSKYHHLPDECEEWGNLLHTLRVCDICDIFCDLLCYNQSQKDKLKCSAILHDCCKFGEKAELSYITDDHPNLAADLIIASDIELFDKYDIYANVVFHMGKWDKIAPVNWINMIFIDNTIDPFILHSADCIEANLPKVLR